jgi:hypothetical protein
MTEEPSRPSLPPGLAIPHPSRCDPHRQDYAEILARHAEAIAARQHFYTDPATGHQVWTAVALWERGFCCEAGCRHCPYAGR